MSNLFLKIPSHNKAKEDIDIIMGMNDFHDIAWSLRSHNSVARFISKLVSVFLILARVKKGDILLIQYPFKKYFSFMCMLAHFKGGKVITLIHDLGSFRRKKLTVEQERKRLSHTDVIIVHNAAMKDFLEKHGTTQPMVELEIFDYLADCPGTSPVKKDSDQWQVVYAGSLVKRKNTFLYLLDEHIAGWHFNIHGTGLDENHIKEWKNITNCGFIKSDDFVRESIGHFGLVWDGSSIDQCAGDWGEYLRINNPHKTSFYIRSGKPVIMWKHSALAPFVTKEGIGFAVESLRDIQQALVTVTPEQYKAMTERTAVISQRLSEGYYFKQAYAKAVKLLYVGSIN